MLPVLRTRKPLATPTETQPDDQHAPAVGQETTLQTIDNFTRWLLKDKAAQAGAARVMLCVMIPIVLVIVTLVLIVAALYLAPTPALVKIISAVGSITAIATGGSAVRRRGKRKKGPLAIVRPAPGPACPVAAA